MMPKGTRTVNAATCRAEFIRPRRVSLRCVRMNSHLRQFSAMPGLARSDTPGLRQLRGAVAGNPDHSEGLQPWHFGPAALDRVRAARMKGAARRRIERRRQLTLERDALPP